MWKCKEFRIVLVLTTDIDDGVWITFGTLSDFNKSMCIRICRRVDLKF